MILRRLREVKADLLDRKVEAACFSLAGLISALESAARVEPDATAPRADRPREEGEGDEYGGDDAPDRIDDPTYRALILACKELLAKEVPRGKVEPRHVKIHAACFLKEARYDERPAHDSARWRPYADYDYEDD